MKKRALIENIIMAVRNGDDLGDSEDDIYEGVESMIDLLEPIDKDKFCQWGSPANQCDPGECWKDD